MALSMPSRFAVLKIEDDDFKPVTSSKVKDKNKKKNDKGASASKKTQNTKVNLLLRLIDGLPIRQNI